jgi:excisionase family DNA binding protein
MMDELISIKQAAAMLGVHDDTVRRAIKRGDIDGRRIGPRLVRITLASVVAYSERAL